MTKLTLLALALGFALNIAARAADLTPAKPKPLLNN